MNTLTISFKACAAILKINAKTFMMYDSPINCSRGITSNITIEDDHYVLVKDSDDNNYCGMYKHVF